LERIYKIPTGNFVPFDIQVVEFYRAV